MLAAFASTVFSAEGGLVPVFDGKSLKGWNCRPADQAGNWKVEDGQIIGRGQGKESYLMFQIVAFKDISLKR